MWRTVTNMPARPTPKRAGKKRATKKRAGKKKKKAAKKSSKKASPNHGARLHAMHNASSANYWMDCDLWYHLKVECERKGIDYDNENEAAQIGTMQHEVDEQAFEWQRAGKFESNVRRCVDAACKALAKNHFERYGLKLTDEHRAECAIAVQAALDLVTPDHNVALEVPIPLSHEPESNGPADLLAYREEEVAPGQFLLVDVVLADYKHGRIKHSPSGHQLKVYGSNSLAVFEDLGLKLQPDTRVRLAIIQPKHYTEAIVRSFTVKELTSFQAVVEHTVERQKGGSRRGANSLSTCEWCDFAKLGICHHKETLVGGLLNGVKTTPTEDMATELIEEIVASRSVLEATIKECVRRVIDDPKRFPNWTRKTVSNGQGWSPLVDADQIGHKLEEVGAPDWYVPKTPKQIIDAYAGEENAEEVQAVVEAYSEEAGTHVRLYQGAPDGSKKKDPPARPNKSTKRGAKKKAAKKAAKKGKKK